MTNMEPGESNSQRLFAGGGAFLCTALVVWNLLQFVGSPAEYRLYLLIIVPAAIMAVFGWWFAFWGHRPDSRAVLASGCLGGLVLGGIGFLAGFIGPMILAPGANQGPLLGILVTGPAGFVLGSISGLVVALIRRRNRRRPESR